MASDATSGADRLVVYPSRVKALLVLLGSLAFVAAGIWMATPRVAATVPGFKVVIVSYISAPLFAVIALYAAYRLAVRRPALVIDPEGLTDSASAIGVGRLSWEEIGHLYIYSFKSQRMLGIVPRHLDLFLSRQPAFRRSVIKANLGLGCAPINIPQVALDLSLTDLATLLQDKYGVHVELRDI